MSPLAIKQQRARICAPVFSEPVFNSLKRTLGPLMRPNAQRNPSVPVLRKSTGRIPQAWANWPYSRTARSVFVSASTKVVLPSSTRIPASNSASRKAVRASTGLKCPSKAPVHVSLARRQAGPCLWVQLFFRKASSWPTELTCLGLPRRAGRRTSVWNGTSSMNGKRRYWALVPYGN